MIGSVGRLEQQKRFDLLMDACASLKRRQPAVSFKLMIAGEGSLRQDSNATVRVWVWMATVSCSA